MYVFIPSLPSLANFSWNKLYSINFNLRPFSLISLCKAKLVLKMKGMTEILRPKREKILKNLIFSHFRLIIPPAILMGITLAFREIPSSNLGIAACSCLGTCRDLQHRNALVFGTTCMNPSSTIRDPIWANWQCGSAPLIGM